MVVNCSGLRARELVNDLSIDPARGQVLRVNFINFFMWFFIISIKIIN